jgi:membrane protein YdbS with pleckstrin-like domain
LATIDPEIISAVSGPGGAVHVDERGVLWVSSEGQVVNAHLFAVGLFAFWLVIPLLYMLWRMLVTARHRYVLTDQRLREFTGVLFQDMEELELYRVKDISVQRPPMQQLCGRGRIVLKTSDASTPTVVLNAIARPLQVADLLRGCVERCRVAKGVREIDA